VAAMLLNILWSFVCWPAVTGVHLWYTNNTTSKSTSVTLPNLFTEESAYEIKSRIRLRHFKINCYRLIPLYETTVVNTNQLKGTKSCYCWNFI